MLLKELNEIRFLPPNVLLSSQIKIADQKRISIIF